MARVRSRGAGTSVGPAAERDPARLRGDARDDLLLAEQLRVTFRGAARQLDRSIRQLEAQVEELRRQKDEYIRLADDAEGRLGDLALEVSQADAKPPEFSA